MADPFDRILGKLDDVSQRLVAVETKQDAGAAFTLALETLERDVNGIGRKVDLHEASPGHGVTLARLEAIEVAVARLNELEVVSRTLKDHIAKVDERRRWSLAQTATGGIALAALLWKVYAG